MTSDSSPEPGSAEAAIRVPSVDSAAPATENRLRHPWRWTLLVFAAAFAASAPSAGDLGLTWDEPAYRYSQMVSSEWWGRLFSARSSADLAAILAPDALLFYWPYGRHGINFHPPLAGQLNLLSYQFFGGWLKDIPARRMSSVAEFSAAVALLFLVLGRRYGAPAGVVGALALFTMPRVFGDAHIAGTDIPGLLLWPVAAVVAWNGSTIPRSTGSRVAFGVLAGLAFLTKMAAVAVLLPVFAWLLVAGFARLRREATWRDGLDIVLTLGLQLAPLAIAFREIRRLAELLPPPDRTNLFFNSPSSTLPGWILAVPLAAWCLRRLLHRMTRRSSFWSNDRPTLEFVSSVLAFAPVVGWLGNPGWWRDTLPRLAHYYLLNTNREGSLPDIRIFYWGETYLYSLPWHNAWVLIALTVPPAILLAAAPGLLGGLARFRSDKLPAYFALHLLTLPCLRMLDTPAHDGVRLLLPAFWFLAAFAGWGVSWISDGLAKLVRRPAWSAPATLAIGSLVVLPSAVDLVRVHPYELSYYTPLIGGPAGAWARGFELSYWYDAYDSPVLASLNDPATGLPRGAALSPPNTDENVPTFTELQSLGELRGDIDLWDEPDEGFSHKWLLTHDSKANGFSKLLFAMRPWFASSPSQLGGARVATIASPESVSRAWALQLMAELPGNARRPNPRPNAPDLVRRFAPFLARFWGDGVNLARPTPVHTDALDWARRDPSGLVQAAQALSRFPSSDAASSDPTAAPLLRLIDQGFSRKYLDYLLIRRPSALPEAALILSSRPDDVRAILDRDGYTDPALIGGYLDDPGRAP